MYDLQCNSATKHWDYDAMIWTWDMDMMWYEYVDTKKLGYGYILDTIRKELCIGIKF